MAASRASGVLECRSIGVLEYWSAGVMEYRKDAKEREGTFSPKSGDFGYPQSPRFSVQARRNVRLGMRDALPYECRLRGCEEIVGVHASACPGTTLKRELQRSRSACRPLAFVDVPRKMEMRLLLPRRA